MTSITINGATVAVDAAPDTPLLWVLRDALNMTGTKYGCGIAACGACTVLIDGQPARACATPLEAVGASEVMTIEGANGYDIVAKAVVEAWAKIEVVQCGYCQSGQVMSAIALLRSNANPTDEDITAAMDGNICRCGTYQRIRAAIHEAAKSLG